MIAQKPFNSPELGAQVNEPLTQRHNDSHDGVADEIQLPVKNVFTSTHDKPLTHDAPRNSPRFRALDGLKVVSCFVVLMHHIDNVNPELKNFGPHQRELLATSDFSNKLKLFATPLGEILRVADGHLAVSTFIILSGYIHSLKFSNISRKHASNRLGAALFTRFFRLALPLIPIQLVSVLMWHYGVWSPAVTDGRLRGAWSVGISSLLNSTLNGQLHVIKIFLFSPFLVAVLQLCAEHSRKTVRLTLYICVSFYLMFSDMAYYFGVVYGAFLADLDSSPDLKALKQTLTSRRVLIPFAMLSIVSPFVYEEVWTLACCSGFLVFLVLNTPTLQYALGQPNVANLARYTYAAYIWHLAVYQIVALLFLPFITGGLVFVSVCMVTLGLTATCLTSFIAYHVFEYPTTLVIKKIQRWYESQE